MNNNELFDNAFSMINLDKSKGDTSDVLYERAIECLDYEYFNRRLDALQLFNHNGSKYKNGRKKLILERDLVHYHLKDKLGLIY